MQPKETRKRINVQPTARDDLIFALLEIIPLTAAQVKKYSQTFPVTGDEANENEEGSRPHTSGPFNKEKTALRRLQLLHRGGYLYNRPYDKNGTFGATRYFQLTRKGWQWQHRFESETPPYPKRQHEAISPSRQHHTRNLADALVHLHYSAHRRGFRMEIISGESEITINNNKGITSLDGEVEFIRIRDENVRFHRLLELECSTHTLRSEKHNKKTWQNRARVIDHDAALRIKNDQTRTRLLTFTSRSWEKAETIADLFKEETKNPDRQVYLGTFLPEFLAEEDGLFSPIFLDHKGNKVPALPSWALHAELPSQAPTPRESLLLESERPSARTSVQRSSVSASAT